MKNSQVLIILSVLIIVLAAIAAAAGLFWQDGGRPYTVTSLRGRPVEIYGQGLYRYETLFTAGILKGTDAVTLLVCVPLLAVAAWLYRRGSLRGGLLLLGALSYFLYLFASLALGAAFNPLFPVYIVGFSASLFAFILAFSVFDLTAFSPHLSPAIPRCTIGIFQVVVAVILSFVWLSDLLPALLSGQAPKNMGTYTTMVTFVLDLGLIAPALFLSGVWVLRRSPFGYVLAAQMLVLNALVGVMVAAQTIGQSLVGVKLTTAELIIFCSTFIVMSLVAAFVAVRLFRNITEINHR